MSDKKIKKILIFACPKTVLKEYGLDARPPSRINK